MYLLILDHSAVKFKEKGHIEGEKASIILYCQALPASHTLTTTNLSAPGSLLSLATSTLELMHTGIPTYIPEVLVKHDKVEGSSDRCRSGAKFINN